MASTTEKVINQVGNLKLMSKPRRDWNPSRLTTKFELSAVERAVNPKQACASDSALQKLELPVGEIVQENAIVRSQV